jgi:hypothetical protein
VYLTSQKVNLLVFLNFFLVALLQLGNVLAWVFFDTIRTIELKVTPNLINYKLVHYGQILEEDLSLPIGDHRLAVDTGPVQAAVPGGPVPLLDRALADLQAERLPHIQGQPRQEGTCPLDHTIRDTHYV